MINLNGIRRYLFLDINLIGVRKIILRKILRHCLKPTAAAKIQISIAMFLIGCKIGLKLDAHVLAIRGEKPLLLKTILEFHIYNVIFALKFVLYAWCKRQTTKQLGQTIISRTVTFEYYNSMKSRAGYLGNYNIRHVIP